MSVARDILDVVVETQKAQCSNPRDIIYTELALARRGGLVASHVKHTSTLDVLRFAGENNATPSWAPIWADMPHVSQITVLPRDITILTKYMDQLETLFREDCGKLGVKGKVFFKTAPQKCNGTDGSILGTTMTEYYLCCVCEWSSLVLLCAEPDHYVLVDAIATGDFERWVNDDVEEFNEYTVEEVEAFREMVFKIR